MKADISAVDRDELPGSMEPLRLGDSSSHRPAITDLAVDLAKAAEGFRRSLPSSMVSSLAGLVRSMNCYYSNLIEGHDTHPVEIEQALRGDYSQDSRKRDLQLEAKAHISVQEWMDAGGLPARRAVSRDGLCEIHRRFGELLPDDLLWVADPKSGERVRVVPGDIRKRDVAVGQHVAISPGAVPRFLDRFEQVYGSLGKAEMIVSAAAAHHRFTWIHPFLDGNGRVARLMSHAMLLDALDTGALWSVSRGLARNVDRYKSLLAQCDESRRGPFDGRGSLSEAALADFTRFFLQVCLDQVAFMESLMQPDVLRTRVLLWAEEEVRMGLLPGRASTILEAILFRGSLARGDLEAVTGTGERQARRIAAALIDRGVIVSESHLHPLRLAFPAELAARWMPNLFPERPRTG